MKNTSEISEYWLRNVYAVYWLLSTTYYYKLIITSLYLIFTNSDKSCSKTRQNFIYALK